MTIKRFNVARDVPGTVFPEPNGRFVTYEAHLDALGEAQLERDEERTSTEYAVDRAEAAEEKLETLRSAINRNAERCPVEILSVLGNIDLSEDTEKQSGGGEG